ncbi:unnamed protein product [Citrullus colocynthis]|uniref:Uncharacterized protein n=1 Tax=Citrullus colocynthis TaxID=252529 RepID=A0ABP0ZG62_9ROSI
MELSQKIRDPIPSCGSRTDENQDLSSTCGLPLLNITSKFLLPLSIFYPKTHNSIFKEISQEFLRELARFLEESLR